MNKSLPRLLLISRNFPPLVGGMEQLNWHMAEELARTYSVRVIAPSGSAALAPVGTVFDEVPLRPLWLFLLFSAWRAIFVALRWRPDVIVAGSGLTAPLAWLAAFVCPGRAVVYLHGLDIALRHPVYNLIWIPAIRRMDTVVVNSSATRKMAIERGVPESSITLLPPGVALPGDGARKSDLPDFRQVYGLGGGPILLSVGRLTERKGLREFVRDVLPQVVFKHPDVQLVVIGDAAGDALLARSQTPESIHAVASSLGLKECVHFVGVLTDRMALSSAYYAASVHVFPVRQLSGDPEGFGMVAIEAAAHAIPTAAYATGGIVDAVHEGISGRLAPPGDAETLSECILSLLEKPLPSEPMLSFAGQFSWRFFGERLRSALLISPHGR